MKISHGGIRDLFRYSLAFVYSLLITVYIIFFAFSLLIPGEEFNTISNIFPKNEKVLKNIDDSKIIVGFFGDNNKRYFGVRISGKKDNRLLKVALINNQNTVSYTNQSLQDGTVIFSKQDIFDETEKFTGGNKFDIEKIIDDLHLQKEKRVAVVARGLGINWEKEKGDYAKLVGFGGNYNGSLEQNQKIRDYLIAHAQEIYKDKHGWNEWDTLPLVAKEEKKVKMNSREITGQVAYNNVILKVSAPVESFPEGTVLKIKTLEDNDSTTTFDITFKEIMLMAQMDNVEYDAPMASFDISFYAPDDIEFLKELQPAEGKAVSVTFDYTDNKEFNNFEDKGLLAIYHIEDNNETSVANLVSVKDSERTRENIKSDSMSIYANTLSVYILTIVSDLDDETSGNNETITFDAGTGGFIMENNETIVVSSGLTVDTICTGKILSKNDEITLPGIQLASGYIFGGWYDENGFLGNPGTKFKLGNTTKIYAKSYIEESDGNSTDLNEDIGNIGDSDILNNNTGFSANIDTYTPSEEEIQKYGQKMFDAYNRAINEGITTIDDINKVNFNKKITRAELAKMMVEFMSGVLEKEPIVTDGVNYLDVDSQKLGDLAGYIQLAYQYQIMGINQDGSPIENFDPSKTVTRAEFATVLSRVLYGDTYNQTGKYYYEKHVDALKNANILSNTDHTLIESRGWIMTMLYNTQL